MAKSSKRTREVKELVEKSSPRCISVAKRGVKSGADFADFMSSLMSDLIEGRVTPDVGNATCNAGGKLLKVVEMEYKHGRPSSPNGFGRPRLSLSAGVTAR